MITHNHNTISILTQNAGEFYQLNIQRIQSQSSLLFIIKFSKHYDWNQRYWLAISKSKFLVLDLLFLSTYKASLNFKTISVKNDQINLSFNNKKFNFLKSEKILWKYHISERTYNLFYRHGLNFGSKIFLFLCFTKDFLIKASRSFRVLDACSVA